MWFYCNFLFQCICSATLFELISLFFTWLVSLSSLGFMTQQATETELRTLTALKHKTSPQGALAEILALWFQVNWT